MEKFDYKSKEGSFTECEIDYIFIYFTPPPPPSRGWDGAVAGNKCQKQHAVYVCMLK